MIHMCVFIFGTLLSNNWFQFVETSHEFGFQNPKWPTFSWILRIAPFNATLLPRVRHSRESPQKKGIWESILRKDFLFLRLYSSNVKYLYDTFFNLMLALRINCEYQKSNIRRRFLGSSLNFWRQVKTSCTRTKKNIFLPEGVVFMKCTKLYCM